MKIGILTFHSQQNYGGVLQCWALKRALEMLGHEVVVIDRWLAPRCVTLRKEFSLRNPKSWAILILNIILGRGAEKGFVRSFRTIRFVRGLGLTKYHFCKWEAAPQNLGVDLVVVGSDQVWHCGDWGRPEPYLFEGYTGQLPRAIAYAASFGMKDLPQEYYPLFKRGLSRFCSISCRESEGVSICESLGFSATHVVDPTLLVDRQVWRTFINQGVCNRKTLVCYFLAVDINGVLPELESFARSQNCEVVVLTDTLYLKPQPRTIKELFRNWTNKYPRVRISSCSGPREFVQHFAEATWILTDSFHGMMFASIFDKNIRFLKPTSSWRRVMFARIEEFVDSCIEGKVLVETVSEALSTFGCGECVRYRYDRIDERRQKSLEWLESAVGMNL